MSSRRQQIRDFYETGYTYEEIGGMVGLSKQRVEQICSNLKNLDEEKHEVGKIAERYNNQQIKDKKHVKDVISHSTSKTQARSKLDITSEYAFNRLLELYDIDFEREFYIELKCANPDCDKGEDDNRKIIKKKRAIYDEDDYQAGPFCSKQCQGEYTGNVHGMGNEETKKKAQDAIKRRYKKEEKGKEIEYVEIECTNPDCDKGPNDGPETITMRADKYEQKDYKYGPFCSRECNGHFQTEYVRKMHKDE